jgi:TRAP-type C4-dicarboxylate transport system substrate-binding protein
VGSDEVDTSDWIKMDISMATYLPEAESAKIQWQYIKDSLEEKMPGLVTITEFHNGTLLKQEDMLEGVKSGTADIGYVDFGTVAGAFPLCQIWAYPSIPTASQVGATAAFTEWAYTSKLPEFKDFVFLCGQASGPGSFITTSDYDGVEGLKGKQIRTVGAMQKTIQALGANPISMPTGEVYEAVRNGMLFGAYASFGSLASQNVVEVAKYADMVPMGCQVYGFVMNKDRFNEMPDSQRIAFMEAWYDAFWNKMIPDWENMQTIMNPTILDAALEAQWTFTAPGTPEYNSYMDKVDSLLDDYVKELDAQGIDGQAEVDKVLASLDKWCAGWWGFERHIEPYKAASEGADALAKWKETRTIPSNWPEIIPFSLDFVEY